MNVLIVGKKINKMLLLEKEKFYSHLNMKEIADAYYEYAKKVCKDFETENLGENHDFHVQSETLLLDTSE